MPTPINKAQTIAVRKQLAKEYCRSILWLDDEIQPEADGAQKTSYINFFVRIAGEFSKQNVLCQLKDFPQIKEKDDPYASDDSTLDMCKALAKKADILILDWHLGAQTQIHSENILRELVSSGGNRFVVILSQEEKLKEQFEQSFSQDFQKEGEWYRHSNGLFVLLLEKTLFQKEGSGTELIDKIYDQLAIAYPDYLHWAAIEIAGRIKSLAHSWLNKLPANTDLAVLAESIHSQERIEEALLENLLDDLKEVITSTPITSLIKENLVPSGWVKNDECQKIVDEDLAKITEQGHIASFKSIHPLTATRALDHNDEKTFKNVISRHQDLSSVVKLKESVEALGEFSEAVSVGMNANSVPRPGIILRGDEKGGLSTILVCISQACDCSRHNHLLFLEGIESPGKAEIGETFLQFNNKRYLFKPKAELLHSLKIEGNPRAVSGRAILGLVRQVALTRLISRFWGCTTRVGINQPRFVRNSRDEKTL